MSSFALLSQPNLDGSERLWPIQHSPFVIGREPPADLVLSLPQISRVHAHIERIVGGYQIRDLQSRNGTFVHGQLLGDAPLRLRSNDQIVLAGVISLTFFDPAETTDGPRVGRLQGVWIDQEQRQVWVDGQLLAPPLSAAQFSLLRLLEQRRGQPVSRAEIVAVVWPDVNPEGIGEEAIDGLIKRLRSRLRETQAERDLIEVVRGHGIRLVD